MTIINGGESGWQNELWDVIKSTGRLQSQSFHLFVAAIKIAQDSMSVETLLIDAHTESSPSSVIESPCFERIPELSHGENVPFHVP